MKTCTFLKGMVAGMAVGVLLDNALRPSPKFRKTQAGKTLHRLTCALPPTPFGKEMRYVRT